MGPDGAAHDGVFDRADALGWAMAPRTGVVRRENLIQRRSSASKQHLAAAPGYAMIAELIRRPSLALTPSPAAVAPQPKGWGAFFCICPCWPQGAPDGAPRAPQQ